MRHVREDAWIPEICCSMQVTYELIYGTVDPGPKKAVS